MIYLDYAATTPISEKALEVYVNVAKYYYGNPSSLHDIGSNAKQILEASRSTLAGIIQCPQDHIYFTSGGSESNQLGLRALLSSCRAEQTQIITSQTEHSSIANFMKKLEGEGYQITKIPVDEKGLISMDVLEAELSEKTALVSIQHVNSETGVIQDVERISRLLKKNEVLFHSDCVQSFCKLGIDSAWFDSMSISGHKIYGPKGVGAVYISEEVDWVPEIPGTSQEKGLKAGTQNVPGIASFAAAAKKLYMERLNEYVRYTNMRKKLLEGLNSRGWKVIDEGSKDNKSPYIIGLRVPGMEGQYLMLECSQSGLAISTGSACSVGLDQPNQTMLAMGRTEEEAREFVRLSLGKELTMDNIEQIIEKIDTILQRHFKKIKKQQHT